MDIWWIDQPRLLGSSNPTVADLKRLRRKGFGVLISLLKEQEQLPRYDPASATKLGFARHNIPVNDLCPPTADQLEVFVRLIAELPPDTRAVIHCQGGTGRTGTFAAAYWVAKGMTVSDAIAHIRKARSHAVETPEQEDSLKDFAAKCKGSA